MGSFNVYDKELGIKYEPMPSITNNVTKSSESVQKTKSLKPAQTAKSLESTHTNKSLESVQTVKSLESTHTNKSPKSVQHNNNQYIN